MKDTKRKWLPISKANIHCMTKRLNHMAEMDGVTGSYKPQEGRALISKVSIYYRDRMDFNELDVNAKKKIMEDSKEKAKQHRLKRQEMKKKDKKAEKKREKEESERKKKVTKGDKECSKDSNSSGTEDDESDSSLSDDSDE
ncbi:hypothetical protein ONE63_001632 [Megalurothrips usitatus]|uniref:Uncharacterized protein n=1 Tax=Megalurothrips usitatus TaxID=439358 RepID=A0AAV7XF78_9NEOP|nr:hypothetical protein ONE63_001632 [Megalurothrips usitatus]